MCTEALKVVLDKTVGVALKEMIKVIKYILCYPGYIDSLKEKYEGLGDELYDMDKNVHNADFAGLEITKEVKELIIKSKERYDESRKFLQEVEAEATPGCCIFDCNCCRRYSRAKSADTQTTEIQTLLDNGNKLKGKVHFDNSKPPPLAEIWQVGYVSLPSRTKALDDLKTYLKDDKLVIGIYGAKGVGKTMLAKKLAADMESGEDFDAVVVTDKKDVKEIQQQIADRIGISKIVQTKGTVTERAGYLLKKLKAMKKVLIIFDDLDQIINLPMIGVQGSAGRIVVVSTSKKVCEDMGSGKNLIEIVLEQGEKHNLFGGLETQLPSQVEQHTIHPPNPTPDTISIASSIRGGNKIIMLDAEALEIDHSDNGKYWKIIRPTPSPRSEALLIKVWCLYIKGKARNLSPRTNYGAYFVYKLSSNAKYFKKNPVQMIVGSTSKLVDLDPSTAPNDIPPKDIPTKRDEDWLEIEMGTFYNEKPKDETRLLVQGVEASDEKSGLHVGGIELRPLHQN